MLDFRGRRQPAPLGKLFHREAAISGGRPSSHRFAVLRRGGRRGLLVDCGIYQERAFLAAKKTGELIPLCHSLNITHCAVEFEIPPARDRVVITATARVRAATGVEMEALTAVAVAALTIYDMCKALDKTMRITDVVLVSKRKN